MLESKNLLVNAVNSPNRSKKQVSVFRLVVLYLFDYNEIKLSGPSIHTSCESLTTTANLELLHL